ncbi:MAG: transketolase [Deltaproteobacteria bacterium]|nr:transketolase [Deltaproteobacteria bacterium]
MYTPQELRNITKELRTWIIEMITEAGSGHPGGSLSCIDILSVLWLNEMKEKDRFILSKGHAVPALYAVLSKMGLLAKEELKTLRKINSRLQGHPDRVRLPVLGASTGSMGQGLSVAQGIALGFKIDKKPDSVFCLIGDGESQEGQIWETALSAPKFKLSNLCVILDNNNGQIDGYVSDVMPIEPITDKWRSFGWHVLDIPGHDFEKIIKAFQDARQLKENGGTKPILIVARTIKGKGVSFMENQIDWHGIAPTKEVARKAVEEIEKNG